MTSEMDERLSDELESLQAILMDEVLVKTDDLGGAEVEISVLPSTAADSKSQYVRVTLVAKLGKGYPDISPNIILRNPRGLDESVVKTIQSEIDKKMESMIGEPVIFELIEVVREYLTESNLPSCHCVICLYGFNHSDDFVKTSCYHYFHSHCLSRHILASERIYSEEQEKLPAWQRTNSFQRLCPVCREIIPVDMDALSEAAPPVERETDRNFELNDELKLLQQQMAALFRHQQSRGGIIDPEAEEIKLLLVTEPSEESPGPGPSEQRNMGHHSEGEHRRGVAPAPAPAPPTAPASRGRGQRGAFSAAKKNRSHFFTASR